MRNKVLDVLREHYEKSSQGMYLPKLIIEVCAEYSEIKPILIDLRMEKLIYTCLGLNGTLIYYKQKK